MPRAAKVILERHIEAPVVRYALVNGVGSIKLNLQGRRNEPDRLFLPFGGRPFFIEFKRPGKLPRKGQAKRIEELRKLGYRVYVCDDVAEGKEFINYCLEAALPKRRKR